MKTKLLISFLSLFLLVSSISFANPTDNKNPDPEKDKVLISVLNYMLTRGHYVQKELNDEFSEMVFNNFIDGLDPSKRYFTKNDLKEFSKYKFQIDNQLKESDIAFYSLVYGRFLDKIKNAKNYYGAILKKPFNYKKDEIIDLDYKKIAYASSEKELLNFWRKQLKLQTIDRIQEQENLDEEKFKKDKSYKKRSFSVLEKKARAEVMTSMENLYIRIDELEHRDWFSTFLNSIVAAFGPHTTYMPPNIKESFDQDMSGKLEGIGARLQKKGIYTHIVELVSGGPAWKQGELEEGDIILKVAQENKEPLDIVGMRLDDAIKFIKGPKDTKVLLTVKKKIDGTTQVITITRDIVQLDETFVKSSVVEKDGKKYGVIDLPKFYINFDDRNFRDSAKDMEKEIERLKEENVEGLLIDLRNNGGGSLDTAIKIAGLFVDKGPVVQIKYRNEAPVVREDIDPKIQWTGSLVLLVNELSASASEIFAAAMQDYNRAVILGGNQTYGKGTVQNILPINKFYPNYDQDLGYLKMTIQKFYRINGGSTQVEGVYSDIAMPTRFSYMKYGERDLEGALPWDKVPQASYTQVNSYSNFSDVVTTSIERINKDPKFQLIDEYAKWLKKEQDDSSYSLNYKQYQKELKQREDFAKKFKSVFKYQSGLAFNSPSYEIPLFKENIDLKEKRNAWHKNLSKDLYISEALNVLSQLKLANKQEIVKN
ncbi:carboxy terminal-processing peptidase [Flavobacteriaceae bacterium]|nr:carboxy terminal-processing peptidase [Flavobacteriaceae bacterium]MDB9893750.1 carboxy terminal-processing peptidase [Flavobacteriaceae bacterium]MDB9927198.1 carboxy terminal-processing peptidase [Flavobacteriaceae bacterium]MDB9955751.1 carboxy terminal-processing peptidase [Flavobacteriaceae bacterium]MDC1343398.1 carboxy terminal-processing peptidase [Flavobacteriaceae bacterium]